MKQSEIQPRTPFADTCARRGVHVTVKRRQILSVFDDEPEELDADTIWRRLRARGIAATHSTIYRLLGDLHHAGVVQTFARDAGGLRLRIAVRPAPLIDLTTSQAATT